MFGYEAPTSLDIRFRLLGFPVRVSPFFWLIMFLLGQHFLGDPLKLLLWMICGFISILVHELGHALFIRRYGSPSAIVLMAFGGYAEMPYPPTSAWKRLVISFAGPAAQLILAGSIFALLEFAGLPIENRYLAFGLRILMVISLFWAVLNLLPIYPLDGGKILREILVMLRLRQPDAAVHIVSIVVASLFVLAGVAGFLADNGNPNAIADLLPFRPSLMMTIWFVLFGFMNYQMLQLVQRHRHYDDWDDDSPPWRR